MNIGQMRNRGIDGSLGLRGTILGDLDWNLNFNGSTYQNEIVLGAHDECQEHGVDLYCFAGGLLNVRDPRAAWGWIAACLLAPVAGPLSYLLLGIIAIVGVALIIVVIFAPDGIAATVGAPNIIPIENPT